MTRRRHILTRALTLALGLATCADEERTLFVERGLADAAPTPDDASTDACVLLTCAPEACGAVPDGCGGALDCGPCTSARCPDVVEPLFVGIQTPQRPLYDARDDALFFLDANGSNRINEVLLRQDLSRIRESGDVLHYAFGLDTVYGIGTGQTFRIRRRGRELDPWLTRTVATEGLDVIDGEVWFTQAEPPTLWRTLAPDLTLEPMGDLGAAPVFGLLRASARTLWWVERDGDGDHLVTRARQGDATHQRRWSAPSPITSLVTRGEGACLTTGGTRDEPEMALWCTTAPDAEPVAIRSWGSAKLLDLDALDADRVLLARARSSDRTAEWLVGTVSTQTGAESVVFTTPRGGLAPGNAPVATDGTCLFLTYRYAHNSQDRGPGDVAWVRIDAPPAEP
jgi:hypothetical protein